MSSYKMRYAMREILLHVYTIVDDYCKTFEPIWNSTLLPSTSRKSGRPCTMSLSEVMSILVSFHLSDYRHFKGFYKFLELHCKAEFPSLVSYSRFVTHMKVATIPLVGFFTFVRGAETDEYFIDSTALAVCKNKRIYTHKVFDGIAKRGKNTMGWFYGLKLHLVCNQLGEPVTFASSEESVGELRRR